MRVPHFNSDGKVAGTSCHRVEIWRFKDDPMKKWGPIVISETHCNEIQSHRGAVH